MDCHLPNCSVHGFSRQAYWSGLAFPSPGELPNPGIESGFLALQADFLPSEPQGSPGIYMYGQNLVFLSVYTYEWN